jgi:hypothetical protein
MKKLLMTLALTAAGMAGAQALSAGMGIMPHATTFRKLAAEATLVVKARVTSVVDSPVEGFNQDVAYYRYNNANESVRRDAVLNVTEILRDANGIGAKGELTVVSVQQLSIEQYPASIRAGSEAIFFLDKRAIDGRWEMRGEVRGMLDAESCGGSLARGEAALADLAMISTEFELAARPAQVQNRILSEIKLDASRLSADAAIELGWNWDGFLPYFDESEKQQLLQLAVASDAGSELRGELITAVGRIKPVGGDVVLVDMIASDAAFATASLGSWALEQYGRASSARMLLDRYVTSADSQLMGRARLITALGIMRPKAEGEEIASRQRFTDVLRGTIRTGTPNVVLEESLLAARDMRFTNNELKTQLTGLVDDFRAGKMTDANVYRRAIVALAATRTKDSREYLLSLKGNFGKQFDKHIDMALLMPFTVLVDGK